MGRGWRLAVLGVGVALFVGLGSDAMNAGGAADFSPSPLYKAGHDTVLAFVNVGLSALNARGAMERGGIDGDGTLYLFGSDVAGFPLPPYAVLAGVAVLLAALTSRWLHSRPVPSPPSEVPEGRKTPLLFAAPSRGPLFKQTVIYVNVAPRWHLDAAPRFHANYGPVAALLPRGLQGLLEVPGRSGGSGAWVLPFGEPGA